MFSRIHSFPFKSVGAAVLFSLVMASGCGKGKLVVNNPRNTAGQGPSAISLATSGAVVSAGDLGASGNYVILSKAGISNVTGSAITGNIAVSPAAATYITGFSLSADATNVFSNSIAVVGGGKVYAADYAVPTPSNLTTAIGNMQTAYTDAASRNPPDFNELLTGAIGGQTLAPGLYTWTTSVTVASDVTLSGGANDIWIFQTTGDVTVAAAKKVILAGGAQAKNVFWQVAGKVTIGTTASFQGIILAKTTVALQTAASMTGRIYSQTNVSLDNNVVTQP